MATQPELVTPAPLTAATQESLTDDFSRPCPPGRVLGTRCLTGAMRNGVDKEHVLSVDNGALRIQQLLKPGWGRAGLAYGPFERRNGLTFGAFLLNGHNASQAYPLPDGLKARFLRWAKGSETERPLVRFLRAVKDRRHWKYVRRRVLQWVRSNFSRTLLDENLAVGWFPSEAPASPLREGSSLIMHAVDPECGELWARTGPSCARTVRSVQNIPMYYVVVLRQEGAAYYAASLPGVPALDAYPKLRPLAIDSFGSEPTVYAGIHQAVLGQIGFRAETRVYRTRVVLLPEFSQWFGSAHAADDLAGAGVLHDTAADIGGRWRGSEGELRKTPDGLIAGAAMARAWLDPRAPSGLIHVLVKTSDMPASGASILWRVRDDSSFWSFTVSGEMTELACMYDGVMHRMPALRDIHLLPNTVNTLQVSDDGENIRLYVNGEVAYGMALRDTRLCDDTGVGLAIHGPSSVSLRRFEAHPRIITAPAALDLGEIRVLKGTGVAIQDGFGGPAGSDLHGRAVDHGDASWRKEIGSGAIVLTGDGAARVVGSVQEPSPGRLAYTLPWSNPGFADVQVTITPPGTRRGQKERGRGGLIFWQDARNYITLSVFVDDFSGTYSIAAFFYVNGFEEIYDAVWSNVGDRIYWGRPYDFRVCFDGRKFMAYVDGEPVLYRGLSDVYPDWQEMLVHRVGIVSNWEWGTDTGSLFRHFVARNRP